MSQLTYQLEPELTVEEFIDVLQRSTLAERRPIEKIDIMAGMLAQSDIILTARDQDGWLVGISRALSDFHYSTYLADLAVDQAVAKQGIGKELLHRTHQAAGVHTTLILLAAPKARTYYPHIGMTAHDSCWLIPGQPQISSSPNPK